MSQFQILPHLTDYEKLPETELIHRISDAKQRAESEVIILGHHYQRPQIVKLSDFVGDSYGLSVKASQSTAQKIVFCGVRFMAESAAILCKPSQKVYHPDPEAGCPMADMANMEQVEMAWNQIQNATREKIIPITYMNSTADLKAFCGSREGIVCTSSNALQTYKWALEKGQKIFFFPDEHLGRNTGKKFGFSPSEMTVWDPHKAGGGTTESLLRESLLILWKGHCPVHMEFKVRDVKHVRKFYHGCKVIVHPECEKEVVDIADANGSTDFIVRYVTDQPDGSVIFVGTEVNLVSRLQTMFPLKKIFKLQRSLCLTMYQINLANLAFALEHLDTLETVDLSECVKRDAKIALDRMLAVAAAPHKSSLPKSQDLLNSD